MGTNLIHELYFRTLRANTPGDDDVMHSLQYYLRYLMHSDGVFNVGYQHEAAQNTTLRIRSALRSPADGAFSTHRS